MLSVWPCIRSGIHYRPGHDMRHVRKLHIHHMHAGSDSGCAHQAKGNGMEFSVREVTGALPVPGDRVVCGLRFELPKSERSHRWASLGIDTRHSGEFGEFVDMEVFVCLECGRDKQKMIRVPRVTVDEAPLIRLLFLAGYQASDPEIQALNMKKVNRP